MFIYLTDKVDKPTVTDWLNLLREVPHEVLLVRAIHVLSFLLGRAN